MGLWLNESESKNYWMQVFDEIHSRYNENEQFDWCLAIPNAMIVTVCLLWKEDFSESISAAVLAGFDTDCNGATVGSVRGAAGGFEGINPKWYKAFDGEINTSVHGYYNSSMISRNETIGGAAISTADYYWLTTDIYPAAQ